MKGQSKQRLFAVIDSFRDKLNAVGNIPSEQVEQVEEILGVRFPEDYRAFLIQYGAISVGEITIYGLSYPADREPSIVWMLKGLWEISPEIPKNLIPIRDMSELGAVVCLQCPSASSDNTNSPIVLWKLFPESDEKQAVIISQDFSTYISEILMSVKHQMNAFSVMEKHVQDFERDYLSVGKLPRNYVWRPYRFCSQDVVLGLTVVRHSVDNNCLEVDVCLTSDVQEFEEGVGAKITVSFLLSEAYKCGGSLEIRFSENVEGGRVPIALSELAEKYGVALQYAGEGRIAPSEARLLYLAISEFSELLQDRILDLYQEERLSVERPCYTLYHGLWSSSQIEQVVLGSSQPESILGGDSQPEQRHLYINDLKHASAAVMGGVLDRKLAKRERNTGSEALDLEDDVRPLEIHFNPEYYAKMYSCAENIPIPWVIGQSTEIVEPGSDVIVLVRVHDVEDLTQYLEQDILVAAKIAKIPDETSSKPYVYILVPRDFEELPQKHRNKLVSAAEKNKIGILVCPETVVSLETDGARRLSSSRIMRE
ncbi:MAG: SMI1/KNR4 family protein [Anaerolineae bacterium]|nr:MAG: SMI1/KNR4 family protein [Anaerolineae bacterium]